MHGGGGDYLDWIQQGRANIILDNLYDAGKIKPMVVVMGDGNIPGSTGAPQDDQFVPELLENLMPAGLSLGGLQTFNTLPT